MAKTKAAEVLKGGKPKQTSLADFFKVMKGSGVVKTRTSDEKVSNSSRNTAAVRNAIDKVLRPNGLITDDHTSSEEAAADQPIPNADSMMLDGSDQLLDISHDQKIRLAVNDVPGAHSQDSSIDSIAGDDTHGTQETDLTEANPEFKVPISRLGSTWASILDGGKAKKRSISNPSLLDSGVETIGEGSHQAVFSVKILQEHSSKFFTGPIPRVDKSDNSVKQFRGEARTYPIIRDNTVIRCTDGKPLLYFIKGAMYATLNTHDKVTLPLQSVHAIRELNKVYPPPPPGKGDSRMQEEQRKVQKEKNGMLGRYMLTYGHHKGGDREPPKLHSHSVPSTKEAMEKLTEYMGATDWEHIQVSKWILAIDPQIHEELHTCYQDLGKDKLQHLYQGPEACHVGLALLINRAEDPHKDQNDARDNWTTTNCWCDFEGGCIVYPDLRVKIAQEPGDLVLCRAAILTHFLETIEKGERFCHVRFTKKNILRPSQAEFEDLSIPCPIEGCSRVCSSKNILKKHLRGPTDKATRAKKSTAYHWFEVKEVKEYMAAALGVRAGAGEVDVSPGIPADASVTGSHDREMSGG